MLGGRRAAAARVRPHVRRGARRRPARVAGAADRPRGHAHRLRQARPGPARRRPAHGQRAQADADGARVRGRGGPRPAPLHRLRRRARPDPVARGRGAAGGRGAPAGAADDHPPRQGPGVPGGVRGRPRARRAARRTGRCRSRATGASGLRLASLGADAVRSDDARARSRPSRTPTTRQEERRIMYVALTRAREHLVLSGATDLEKRKEPEALTEPLRWMWRHLVPDLPADDARGESGWRATRAATSRCAGSASTPARSTSCCRPPTASPRGPTPEPEPVGETPPLELGMMAAPRALPVARLSYSGLESYRRCGYRFYLERALRLPASDTVVPEAEPGGRAARAAARQPGPPAAGAARHAPRPAAHPARCRGPDRAARPAGARGRRGRPARHGRALLGLRAARPPGGGPAGAGRAAVLLHARAAARGRAQPAGERVRGRATRWRTTAR